LQQRLIGRAYQERRKQRVFLGAGGRNVVNGLAHAFRAAVEVGTQNAPVDAGCGFDEEHALRRHTRPVRD